MAPQQVVVGAQQSLGAASNPKQHVVPALQQTKFVDVLPQQKSVEFGQQVPGGLQMTPEGQGCPNV